MGPTHARGRLPTTAINGALRPATMHEISLKSPFVQSRSYGFLVATFFGTLINRLRQHYESFSIPGSIVHTPLKEVRAHTKLLRPIRHPFHFGMGFGAPGVVSASCLPGELLSINKWAKMWPRSARKKPFEPFSKPFSTDHTGNIQGPYGRATRLCTRSCDQSSFGLPSMLRLVGPC